MAKVAVFVPSLRGGGAERVMVTIANEVASRGHEVDLVLGRAAGPYQSQVSRSVNVVNLGASRMLFSLLALRRYLVRARPDGLLSAMTHANLIAVAARAIARSGCRLVISERNVLRTGGHAGASIKSRVMRKLMRKLYPRADRIVAVSSGVAKDVRECIGVSADRISVIANPVVTAELRQLAEAPVPHPWLAEGEPPVVLGAGRMTEAKDFDTLVEAFGQLRQVRACRLIILGEGELRAHLEEKVVALGLAEDVSLPGFQLNPFSWMSRAGVFALSSRWEGLPGVLVQAMACGTPIVSTDCHSGPREILEDGKWGRLVPVGDVNALAAALREALDDGSPPDVRQRAAHYSAEVSVTHYLRELGVE